MAASVRIEDEAFADSRYDRLAAELGLPDADCARGKMARIWRQCTIEQRHSLDVADIVAIIGAQGPDALVAARLGVREGDKIRIKGTRGRIEWLKKLRGNGRFGKLGGRPKRNPEGLAEKPTRVSRNSKELTPPAPAPAPAQDHDGGAPSATAAPPTPTSPEVIRMPLLAGKEFVVTQADVDSWRDTYPAIDVLQQLKALREWCLSNPAKRKRNGRAFITRNLARKQEEGGGRVLPIHQAPARQVEEPPYWQPRKPKTPEEEKAILDWEPPEVNHG